MVQLSLNEFVNLKINLEQAVQDWNAEQEAANKSITSHNHLPLANGPLKDMSQRRDLSRSSPLRSGGVMVTWHCWDARSGHPGPTSSLVSSRAQNTSLSSINRRCSIQGRIIVSRLNTTKHPPQAPSQHATKQISVPAQRKYGLPEVLEATSILTRENDLVLILAIWACAWKFPGSRMEKKESWCEIQTRCHVSQWFSAGSRYLLLFDDLQKETVVADWPSVRRERQDWNRIGKVPCVTPWAQKSLRARSQTEPRGTICLHGCVCAAWF